MNKNKKREPIKTKVHVATVPLTLIFAYDYAACLEYADQHKLPLVDWIFCHSEKQLDEYWKADSKFVFLKNWRRGSQAAFIKRVEEILALPPSANVVIVNNSADK